MVQLASSMGRRPLSSLVGGIAALLLLASARLEAQQVLITQNGTPKAVIVYAREPSDRVASAIKELQHYIYLMSGATVDLRPQPEAGLHSLYLFVRENGDPVPGSRALSALNQEGFILRVSDDTAWLCGRSELGLQHAIYWLLEQWGCRWLFPGPAGEAVPLSRSLSIDKSMETDQQPYFLMRDIWYDYGSFVPESSQRDHTLWMRRNRLEYSLRGSIGHAYKRIVSRRDKKLLAAHPEYFPRFLGFRVRCGQICTGNQGVRERAVRYALKYFRRNPESMMVSLSPNDGLGPWRCPENRKYRFFTDAALDLANYVAEALAENATTQDKMVAMYGYLSTSRPPTIRARDNVIVFFATRLGTAPWRRRIGAWRQKTAHLGIQDYASILPWHWTRPAWRLEKLQRNVQTWREYGVEAVNVESGNDWGGWGLYHYVMGRLLWDPDADIERILADFLEKGFGGAALQMKRYFMLWRSGYADWKLRAAARDIGAALEAADSRSVEVRIEQYALYVHYLRLLAAYKNTRRPEQRAQALRKLVEFGWRIASTNMANAGALIEDFLWNDARILGVRRQRFESWKVEGRFQSSEIRALLREDYTR
jgi:hypothetical protein